VLVREHGTLRLVRALLAALLALALAAPMVPEARPRSSSSSYRTSSPEHHRSRVSTSPGSVRRDANGKIHRERAAKDTFRRSHPCPSTGKTRGACPGYEVDHVMPLACGGADDSGNMQWLTAGRNRAKGSEGCRR
jgi:5-methylcytosine-specific restriction endonuclease McrA